MASEKKPMEPERLAHFRAALAYAVDTMGDSPLTEHARELLAAHDYHEQRAVDAEQRLDEIRRAIMGDTACSNLLPYVESICTEINHRAEDAERLSDEIARLRARVRVETRDVERVGATWDQAEAWVRSRRECDCAPALKRELLTLRDAINLCADIAGRPGLDILDEMAAMELPG